MLKIIDYHSDLNANIVLCMIVFAVFHRKVDNIDLKRWLATVFGFILTCVLMAEYTFQHVFLVISSLMIIKVVGWRKCHTIITWYVLLYITLFRFTHIDVLYNKRMELCLHQMLTSIKLIGLAFDIHLSNRVKDKRDSLNKYEDPLNPSFIDLIHYIFSYTGMVIGPYIRYRTYDHYLKYPFAKRRLERDPLYKKMISICVFIVLIKLISKYFPIKYILTDDFRKSNFLLKNLANFMYILRFKLWITCGTYTAHCLCVFLGIGVYPKDLKCRPAHGPIEKHDHLQNISLEDVNKLEYGYETVNTMNFMKIHTAPWQSEFWRNWNLTAQYCMGRYFYMELFGKLVYKDYRIILTMFISALWHGTEVGYFTSLVLCGVYLISEKPYQKLYMYTTGWVSVAFLSVMWLVHCHIFSHLMLSFILLEPYTIHLHAAAMNYVPYISLATFYLGGKLISFYIKNYTK